MSLKAKIEEGIKDAMRNKDKDRLRALRAIKSQILLSETEKGSGGSLSEEVETKVLTKAAKQRRDSLEIYEGQGREDLAFVERQELAVIEEFLPKQLSTSEVEANLKGIIEATGAQGPSDMGKVMGQASKQMAGRADGKIISQIARKLLS